MATATFFISLEPDRWTVTADGPDGPAFREGPVEPHTEPEPLAAAIREALAQFNYAGQGVCLGVGASLVLTAGVEAAGLARKHRRTGLLYRLEEQLPLEAERLTADFVEPPVAGRCLAVAVETAAAQAIVEAFTHAGIQVEALCPTALLAAWEACRARPTPPDYVLLQAGPRVDVVRLVEGRPVAWHNVPHSPEELTRCLGIDLLSNPIEREQPTALAAGDATGRLTALLRDHAIAGEAIESPVAALAWRAAAHVLAGGQAGWVNLRRDALAPPHPWRPVAGLVRLAAGLALALVLTAVGACLVRGWMCQGLIARAQEKQASIYARLYPNTAAPANIKSRLRSQGALLAGVSGLGQDVPDPPSALDQLRTIAEHLPRTVRLRITEIRIEPGTVMIDGQARSHGDAELITQSLRKAALALDAPRTETLADGGVGFAILARPASETPAPGAGASKGEGK
ncbi:MAG: hypothetical protein NTV86_10275 [Planctomycetota bacterium]|nr:hypothetical protein [Planctomycetota bacterium]